MLKGPTQGIADETTCEANDEFYTSGVIIRDGLAHIVTIHRSLLIMDARRYARAQADAHERDAKTSTSESDRALMLKIGRDLRRWAEGDRKFLDSATTLWECSVSLSIRVHLGFLKVTQDNYEDYLDEVMERTVPARRTIPPTFLFLTGPGQPELFATQHSAHLPEFAGEWMHRQVVSERDLQRILEAVAQDYPVAHEVLAARAAQAALNAEQAMEHVYGEVE